MSDVQRRIFDSRDEPANTVPKSDLARIWATTATNRKVPMTAGRRFGGHGLLLLSASVSDVALRFRCGRPHDRRVVCRTVLDRRYFDVDVSREDEVFRLSPKGAMDMPFTVVAALSPRGFEATREGARRPQIGRAGSTFVKMYPLFPNSMRGSWPPSAAMVSSASLSQGLPFSESCLVRHRTTYHAIGPEDSCPLLQGYDPVLRQSGAQPVLTPLRGAF